MSDALEEAHQLATKVMDNAADGSPLEDLAIATLLVIERVERLEKHGGMRVIGTAEEEAARMRASLEKTE